MILVTGGTGFVGSYLLEKLTGKYEVYCVKRRRSRMDNVKHIHGVKWIECDLLDPSSTSRALEESNPEKIFHLAAQTHVPTSFTQPFETLNTNIFTTLNILEAIRKSKLNPVMLYPGSSEEYGYVHEWELPITEENPLRPLSPYAVSKVACSLLCQQYSRSYGLKIVVTRTFNHEGPRRPEDFAPSSFAKQVALAELKGGGVVEVGNLDSVRDYLDVRDVVEAYIQAVEKCRYGEPYNICSGRGWRMREVLDTIVSYSNVKIKVKQNPKLLRPSDVPILIGSNRKFREATGWTPKIRFEETLLDMLNWWRETLRNA